MMQTDKKTQRKVQFLCLLIALFLLIPAAYSFVQGFTKGYNSSEILHDKDIADRPSYIVNIKPEENILEKNISSSTPESRKSFYRKILYCSVPKLGTHLYTRRNYITVFSHIHCIYIHGSLFMQVIVSVAKDGLMVRKNIKRLRRLSYSMLVLYLSGYLSSAIFIGYCSAHISIPGYKICNDEIYPHITIAIIFLLLAETLNIAYKLKEEQDLTI
ncbi:MAG: DUF2975 domain-containing protein [Barnesiella sp.]